MYRKGRGISMRNETFRKGLVCVVMVLFIGMGIMPIAGSLSMEKHVSTDNKMSYMPVSNGGKTLYVGGDGPGNYSSIQDAIDDAEWDDTVFVYDDSSPYCEHVIIDKRIQLIGEEKNTTIIDGEHIGDVIVIDEYVGRSIITGFTIQNSGNDYYDAAIENRGGNNLIAGNIITNNDGLGIYCNGMDYERSIHNIISGNIFTHNGVGIFLDYSFDNEVYDNYVSDNGGGIDIGMSKLPSVGSNFLLDDFFNNVYQNTITNNTYGIYLYPSWYVYIYENNITNNKYGISIDVPHLCSCKHNYIYQNNIMNNQDGVLIWANFFAPAEYNYIYQNNFIGNVNHATDTGKNNKWDNGSGNYWDDYEGIDSDGDGIGDTPYGIPEESNDRFPLMTARGIQSDPPNKPTKPSGKSSGIIPFVKYTYSTSTDDPDGDMVRYLFDWGDETTSWTGYFNSGETAKASHRWRGFGPYEIRVKAKDIYGYESDWSDSLPVTKPNNYQNSHNNQQSSNPLFFQILERLLVEGLLSSFP